MKTSLLLLSLLSFPAFAANLDTLQKNLSNPELYKEHHVTIVKEEKHKFLFFPYTKQVVVSDIKMTGTDVVMSHQLETPYISSISTDANNQVNLKTDTIKTGLFVNIKTLENSNKQTMSFSNSELVSLENFTTNLHDNIVSSNELNNTQSQNDNEPMTIQLPTIKQNSFVEPINKNHFEKTWKDSSGIEYKIIYNGQKNLVKS